MPCCCILRCIMYTAGQRQLAIHLQTAAMDWCDNDQPRRVTRTSFSWAARLYDAAWISARAAIGTWVKTKEKKALKAYLSFVQ